MLCGWGDGFWGIRASAVWSGLSTGERAADGWATPTSLTTSVAGESAPNSALAGLRQAELICRQQLTWFGLSLTLFPPWTDRSKLHGPKGLKVAGASGRASKQGARHKIDSACLRPFGAEFGVDVSGALF
jgi:hypothetical protein